MVIVQGSYTNPSLSNELGKALQEILATYDRHPLFICIGSDRHILDSFGPLTGSLLKDKIPDLNVYGTLQEPLHARNMVSKLNHIHSLCPNSLDIAIDASVGDDNDLGVVRLRCGALLPGKALSKRLPAIGDISITGVVGIRSENCYLRNDSGSLCPVYRMAWVVSEAVLTWYNSWAKRNG